MVGLTELVPLWPMAHLALDEVTILLLVSSKLGHLGFLPSPDRRVVTVQGLDRLLQVAVLDPSIVSSWVIIIIISLS